MAPGIYLNTACTLRGDLDSQKSTDLVDHYKILDLDHWATSEEIKHEYRRLREQYFKGSPDKYRALVTAYTVLVDREARLEYDTVYRQRIGLPAPPRPVESSPFTEVKSQAAAMPTQPTAVRDIVNGIESKLSEQSDPRRSDDPNWALKHPNPVYKPMYGTQAYWSYIPIALKHIGEKKRMPKYIGEIAKLARPL